MRFAPDSVLPLLFKHYYWLFALSEGEEHIVQAVLHLRDQNLLIAFANHVSSLHVPTL